jgi:Protein of unknown function (DUF3499)
MCERPGCAEVATVAYGFDPARASAWLKSLAEVDGAAGGLCGRHATAMAVPRGWLLDDRRVDPAPALIDLLPEAPADAELALEWTPIAVARHDVPELAGATTPLLARAFGTAARR